jgi:anti-sigma regulatory factor (Ser/Thr protein kinase)/CheY-like chemotaxis protein
MSPENQGRQIAVMTCCCEEELARRVAQVLSDCRVEEACDESGLMAAMEKRAFDVVLTGHGTSGSEAVALLRRIRAQSPETRVILKPRESTREDLIAAMRAGVFSYFSKPYFEAAFDEILRHAVNGSDWQDSVRVSSATSAWLRIIVRCDVAAADRVTQFINEVSDLTGKDRESMGFAFKEILMNAMEYGGRFNRERLVEVSYVRGTRMILYRIRDPGDGFSLEELTHAAISNPPEEPVRHLEVRDAMGIRPGGFGVMLTRKLVDDLIYSEQGNDVLLIKYLDAAVDGEAAT